MSGSVNYCDLWFDKKPPELTSWANSTTTGEAKHTDTYDAVFCEHPHIEGITPLSVDKPANVPEDGNDLSVEMNVGIIYDYLGAIWPLQKFDITCDQSDKNIKIDHRDGKWYLVLPPDSNASEDYDVTINQQVYEEEDFHTSTKVTVHTFDYHFTFVDENGNVISEQTVDYGDQVSIPENPEGQSARYVCDQIADWENTTTGPKDRTVKVYHITDSTYNGKLNFNNGGGFVGRDTGNYYTDGPDCVHIELCLFAPQAGSSYDRADPFAFFSHGRVLTSYYTAEWRDYDPYAPVMHGVPLQLWKVPGQGTETDPKILSGYGAYGWDTLRCITERESTHGIYFRQDSDMKVFSSVGDDNHYFEGVFDGNGKTLEACFKYNGVNSVAAPFGRINNATIKGVTVTGQIHAAHCAGLVFNCSGDSKIDQCEIHADIKGGDLTGGYVSKTIGTLTITNSTFEGTINGGSQCGGFVARGSAFTRILRSIFMPSGSSACKSGSTFVEGNFWKITDCHYTVPFGNAQGRPIDHSSPDPDNNGDYKAMLQVVKLISKLPDPTSMTLVDKEKVQVRSSQRRRQRPASSPKKRQIRRPLRKPSRSLRKARHITSGFELIIS